MPLPLLHLSFLEQRKVKLPLSPLDLLQLTQPLDQPPLLPSPLVVPMPL
jgi:hypothetical protein